MFDLLWDFTEYENRQINTIRKKLFSFSLSNFQKKVLSSNGKFRMMFRRIKF